MAASGYRPREQPDILARFCLEREHALDGIAFHHLACVARCRPTREICVRLQTPDPFNRASHWAKWMSRDVAIEAEARIMNMSVSGLSADGGMR